MTRLYAHIIVFFTVITTLVCTALKAQDAVFVPNQGQWKGDFDYKLNTTAGAMFFDEKGWYCMLLPERDHHHSADDHPEVHLNEAANIRMTWVNANAPEMEGRESYSYHHNYILGNNPDRWRSNVPCNSQLLYTNLYPGIDVLYQQQAGKLKYDIHLKAGTAASQIKMRFEGADEVTLTEGRLVIHTAIGTISEWIPEAYQIINGRKKEINCRYTLEDGQVGFSLGKHNTDHDVVIDPILVFSTYNGSIASNFGLTATYDLDGNFYGGGAALQVGFQATPGSVQIPFGGGEMDVTINKFSADGSTQLYATHLGGSFTDAPHSLNISPNNELIILGNTDSDDFPVSGNAYQSSFVSGPDFSGPGDDNYKYGSNIFVAKLNSSGTTLLSSTYFGGSGGDGINQDIYKNYGDHYRGDILVMSNGNIAFTSNALSKNLPLNNNGLNLINTGQKAVVVVFNSSLSQMVWGSYLGGTGSETGYSIKTDGTFLYTSGSTTSGELPNTGGAVDSLNQGKMDGYISKFRISDGTLIRTTFIGGPQDDQAFFIDLDRNNDIYVHGQTKSTTNISSGKYGTPNARQYIQKLNYQLDSVLWSTALGTGTKTDWVPTAFMVDRCYNIYISGWNGMVNEGISGNNFSNNNTNNLPVSADAFQKTTDGSDFYFMVLSRDAESFLFGSYFGGTSEEHVDGGTSRFSPDGIIYQAVCAGCFGQTFPTTPQSYSPTKPNNECNLGAIKIDFQQTVRSLPIVSPTAGYDTICDDLIVNFSNNSLHANDFFWDFGNGQTSTADEPSVTYSAFGTYTVTLIARDTVCDIADTNTLQIVHSQGAVVNSDFSMTYAGCDRDYEVSFTNNSSNGTVYLWSFGDGNTSNLSEPTHSYTDSGQYTIRLIAINTICNKSDTLEQTVSFIDSTIAPEIHVSYPECSDGKLEVGIKEGRDRYIYSWQYNSKSISGAQPDIRFNSAGIYQIDLNITDTLCNVEYQHEFEVRVDALKKDTYIPNAFTPDGDGVNDHFEVSGESCEGSDYMRIYNRWGQLIFETNDPFNTYWDGTYKGKPAQQGVYTFILKVGEKTEREHVTLIR